MLFELDSGELARWQDGGEGDLVSTLLATFATKAIAEAWAVKAFGDEAGKEWRAGHLNQRELDAALAGGKLPLVYGG